MSNLHNRAGMSTGTSGQGTMTLSGALGPVAINVASFQSFANSGVVDQEIVQYLILDVNGNWEVGTGTYTASGPTLTRVVKYSNNSNTAISLSGNAQVFICALASDGFDVLGGSTNPMRGFDTPVNLQINATSNGTLLTVAVKGNNGLDPSPTNPVYIPFRDSTAANGDPIWRIVTSALSINTNAAGATLGSINNTAFRFWVCAFDNAGAVVLALINCSSATTVFPINEGAVATTTGVTASSTSAGVFYTPNGTALTNKSFRILGYIEYNAGLATAGTYSTAPTSVQIFGPGIRRPGEVVQSIYNPITGVSTTTNNYTHSNTAPVAANGGLVGSQAITPSGAPNHVRVTASLVLNAATAGTYIFAYLTNSTPTTLATVANTGSGAAAYVTIPMRYEAVFGSTSAVTFNLYGSSGSGTTTFNGVGGGAEFGGTSSTFILVEEIMG